MRQFGLIGYPLGHSYSARYFAGKFESEGLQDCSYDLFPLQNLSDLHGLVESHPALEGLNVTIPYKEKVIGLLSSLDAEAESVGAVNVLKITRHDGTIRLRGYNTDTAGFEGSLLPLLQPWHRKALVFGTGGGAKAVSHVLNRLGICVLLASRTKAGPGIVPEPEIQRELLRDRLLIVNATPAGMHPHESTAPEMPYEGLTSRHLLFDLVYNPAETRFMKLGREHGAAVCNGLGMLHLQAERSWEIWNDK